MASDRQVLAVLDHAFGGIEKPEHFTDHMHCGECAEHDETLRSHDRNTLKIGHVNNPGWNPLCFSTAHGKAYYVPTLARFFLRPSDNDSFALNFLFMLTSDGQANELLLFCSQEQRSAIASLLNHVITTRAERISDLFLDDDLCEAHTLWSTQ